MRLQAFTKRTRLPVSAARAFRWHARPGAFQRLQPPWESVRVLAARGGLADGGQVELEVRVGPIPIRWVAEHRDVLADRQFRDVQVKGPFARWVHTHRFESAGDESCWLEDHVEYALPLGGISDAVAGRLVQRKLQRMFDYRHRVTALDLEAMARTGTEKAMRILVSGSRGLIGSALVPLLTTGGHEVVRLVRGSGQGAGETRVWDPSAGRLDPAVFDRVDAVVHLAGESIAGRWTASRKERIRESRVRGTRLLAERLAALDRPPRTLVCASAIGYYGHRGDTSLREDSPAGSGFLSDVCREWEAAAEPARKAGIRVLHLRFGVVLSPAGGALARMLLPFRLGAGGMIGGGKQFWSWIALDDAIGAVLARVLHRPAFLPMPRIIARVALGEMAQALLLASTRVEPAALERSGYAFRHPELENALRHLLGRDEAGHSTSDAAR
jgi:uncharacterized protein (TIGR01777 family)